MTNNIRPKIELLRTDISVGRETTGVYNFNTNNFDTRKRGSRGGPEFMTMRRYRRGTRDRQMRVGNDVPGCTVRVPIVEAQVRCTLDSPSSLKRDKLIQ